MLIALSGLPGTGKTTIARELALTVVAVHLRVDTIEQALREGGHEVRAEGYQVAYAIAADNLRLGHVVVADTVNPWPLTRDEWRAVAERCEVPVLEVEVVCSDLDEHRRRIESRESDIPGHRLPSWQEVLARDYHPWHRPHLVVDTARLSLDQSVQAIVAELPSAATVQRRR